MPADVVLASSTPLTIALPGIVARVAAAGADGVRGARPVARDADRGRRAAQPASLIAVAARGRVGRLPRRRARDRAVARHGGRRRGRGIPRARITVIPNGCDLARVRRAARRPATRIRAELGARARRAADRLRRRARRRQRRRVAGRRRGRAAAAATPTRGSSSSAAAPGATPLLAARRARAACWTRRCSCGRRCRKRDIPALLAAATVATSLFRPIPRDGGQLGQQVLRRARRRPAGRDQLRRLAPATARRARRRHRAARVATPRPRPGSSPPWSATTRRWRAAARRRAALAAEQFDRDLLAEEFAGVLERVAAGVR